MLLLKYGFPESFTNMFEALHRGMTANVCAGEVVSEKYSVTNKARLPTGPNAFLHLLSTLLDEAFGDMGDGVYIQSRQSADLFNVTHFRANTKTIRILMRELLFADDRALAAKVKHKIVYAFSGASKSWSDV